MGDSVVDIFLETLKQLITSSKLGLFIDEKCQLQSLEEEIKYLRGFLKITEKKRNNHSKVMKLVMHIRDLVFEAENIVELFVVHAFKVDHAHNTLREHHDHLSLNLETIKKRMKTLTAEVKKIYDENMYDIKGEAVKLLKHYSTESEGSSGSSRGSYSSKLVKETEVVGFKEEVKKIIDKLDDRREGKPLEIISIIGTGGGGKTTLAREVYDDPFTSYTFEIRAWINVSQAYDKTRKRDLLICILESISPEKDQDYGKSNDDKLAEDVHKCLKGRKYLIVMDDIWDIEVETNWSLFVENFQLLRVLSFMSSTCHGEIGIGYLVHLRYLALTLDEFLIVKPFSYHWNLETLILNVPTLDSILNRRTICLPCDIIKMVKLRHLYTKNGAFAFHLYGEETATIGFDPYSTLESLQTLQHICACKGCRSFLVRTPNLRKLGLYGGESTEDNVLRFPDLDFLKCLERLTFTVNSTTHLLVKNTTLPLGLKLPLTIKRITFKHTRLKWEELSILQTLPSLEVLILLWLACRGPVWNTSELEGFPQLKYLRFVALDIEEWDASKDQFPKLEVLVLEYCRRLKRIPIDFANLKELREIKLEACRRTVEESAREIREGQRNRNGDDDCLNLFTKHTWGH
ncbi:hypothetical protein Vadar_020711 [Vaccinium darrowii]|uniref:Uncharacterized protein n=1 Tax=Vaccinium darrowii TaxID=229202 RepID=A0ACB7Y0N5_9ERIC|nr:hypothetical protein Vadar_020711 [Vaccinium darrowii]